MTNSESPMESVAANDEADPEAHLWRLIRTAGSWRDLLLLTVIPVVLVLLFALPPNLKRALAFDYTNPTLVTAFTSHFVHFSRLHLLSNLVGGAVVVPTAYLLSVLSGRRRQFLTIFACFVLAFPFVLSALNLVFVRPAIGVGFSGIILAFVGYLGIVLVDFVGARYDAPVDGTRSEGLFFVGLALIIYDVSAYGPLLALAALLASALFVRDIGDGLGREWLTRVGRGLTERGNEPAALGVVVFLVYPLISVPADPQTASGVVNVYTHALGFCLGYIVTYVTLLFGAIE